MVSSQKLDDIVAAPQQSFQKMSTINKLIKISNNIQKRFRYGTGNFILNT